jgi:hypothetical protein
MAQGEYKTLGDFLRAKASNLFTRLEAELALDGTPAKQIAAKMTALEATMLAKRIAELKPSEWEDGALGARKLMGALEAERFCSAEDKAQFRDILSAVAENASASALLLRYCLMFEEAVNSN